ncbi:hypothetical protein Nepgr_000496 [Nepenthes gracilis]|uniref:Uncharacterized protein n=1 Tax=Nepenthes gracilis TaxID=150966 RepID=A0AAD3P6S6_NEPGR|nr:hypothetical protein Nepgr_000496 [Nepenthes gracilis]
MKKSLFDLYFCFGGRAAGTVVPSPLPPLPEEAGADYPVPTYAEKQQDRVRRTGTRRHRMHYATEWRPSLAVISEAGVVPEKKKAVSFQRKWWTRFRSKTNSQRVDSNNGDSDQWEALMAMIPPAAFSPAPFML